MTVDDGQRASSAPPGVARFGVIVTRPGAAGSALVAELVTRGASAVAAPAFKLGPPPDEEAAAQALRRLAEFDLVVFVSPAAVRAVAERSTQAWPAHTTIAVVGAATAQVVENDLPGARHARRIAPAGQGLDSDSVAGSEALWTELERAGLVGSGGQGTAPQGPRRVLLLRAQSGREWLAERFAAIGAHVETAAVYSRVPATPDTLAIAAMRTWRNGGHRAALVVTSSEAIDVVGTRWAAHLERAAAGMRAWLRAGVVLAPHRRIVDRAQAAGYDDVRLVEATADAVLAALGTG